MMTDDDILRALRQEADGARDWCEQGDDAEDAIEYFYGRLPAQPEDLAEQGLADIVSTDVADAVEAVLAEILPAFSAGAVEFEPLGAQDEPQANLETKAVHHTILANGGYMAVNLAVKDALLRRVGVIKTTWEERRIPQYRTLEGAPLQFVIQAEQSGAEVLSGQLDPNGQTFSGALRRYQNRGKPRIEPVPREELLVSPDATAATMDEVRFIAHQRPVLRSDIVAMGIDPTVANDLSAYRNVNSEGDDATRRPSSAMTVYEPGHRSSDLIMCLDSYYRIDADGDGIAELRRIITAGGDDGTDTLLFEEPWDEHPFSVGIPYLGLYSWDGVSLFDKLRCVQDFKTELLRDVQDTARRNARGRTGVVEGDANLSDVLTSLRGGTVRCRTPQGVFQIPGTPLDGAVFSLLEYSDKLRRDKGGGAIDTAAQTQALAGDTAHGLERMMSAAEAVNAMLARNLAETLIKPMYRRMHRLMRRHFPGPVQVTGPDGWVPTVPAEWSPRSELVISMGMSVGERTRRTATLQTIIQGQQTAMGAGLTGVLVDKPQIYQALVDLGRMGGLPNPEQYWIDPSSQAAQQAAQSKAQQDKEAKERADRLAEMQYTTLQQVELIKAENRLKVQAMQNQMDQMQASLRYMSDMFGQRVKLATVESDREQAITEAERLPVTPPPPPEIMQ